MRKILLLFIIFLLHGYQSFSQNFSNKGKDFWVGYGYHQVMTGNNGQEMVLYFATDQITTVTVSIPGLAYTQTYTNIPANTIFTTPALPKVGFTDARLMIEGISTKGIHIESTKPMVAYAHIYNASVSGACVLLPTNTLGKEYYSINYTNNSNNIFILSVIISEFLSKKSREFCEIFLQCEILNLKNNKIYLIFKIHFKYFYYCLIYSYNFYQIIIIHFIIFICRVVFLI